MKRIISLIIIIFMLSIYTYPLKVTAQDKITPAKAIEIAKSAFNLNTDGYNLNQNYFESTNGRKTYELNWYSKKQSGGYINVSVDAETGEILNMNMWDGSSDPSRKIPKYSKSSAQKVAEETAKKLQPDKFNQTKLSDKAGTNYVYDYSDAYTFYFIRQANNIEVSDNSITISVDKNTLKIRSYSLNWDNMELSDPSKAISIDNAKEIFKNKLGLELAYSMAYNKSLKKNVPILVYSLKNGNMPIDAVNGDVIKNGYYGPYYAESGQKEALNKSQAADLTPEEQKVIDSSSKYITRDKAIEIAKKYLPLNEKYKLMSANLYSNSTDNTASWYMYWENNDPSSNTYNYMNAQVDAINAEIKSFYYGGSDFDQPSKDKKPVFNKEQSVKIASDFIKEIYPERFEQIEYRESSEYYPVNDQSYIPPTYYFRFVRKTDGITYNFDSINVNVNTYTGKVNGFNMNWSRNLELPSNEGIKSIDDAYNILFNKLNFSLKYIKCYDYTKPNSKPQFRLAYCLNQFSGIIDAKTGYVLDYSGNPVKEQSVFQYNDIKGNPNENNIKLLAEMGILKDDTDKFRPNDKILQKDFIKFLISSIDPYAGIYSRDDSYDTYYEQAVNRKIISEKEKSPESFVTRQQAAKMVVKALGIGFIADIPNIYNISKFKDADLISPAYKGYAAIASELKILTPVNNCFNASFEITRGDAATIIVNFLNVDTTPKE